jgi:hypothetical protein
MWISSGLITSIIVVCCVFFNVIPTIEEWLQDRRDRKEIGEANANLHRNNYWDENYRGGTWRRKDGREDIEYPYKRGHLIALRTAKITASDPPSTWWPGER